MKLLILNGPNLNLLGKREPGVYGNDTLESINAGLAAYAQPRGIELRFTQSNHEGALIDALHDAQEWADGVVFNPGGYTHTSVALRDAIAAIRIPVVEVHISNVYARESFRHTSLVSAVCRGKISGFGAKSYLLAVQSFEA